MGLMLHRLLLQIVPTKGITLPEHLERLGSADLRDRETVDVRARILVTAVCRRA